MEAAIEAIGVSRSFGGVPVVHDASLQVHPGEITALVGPNGSGKTTLMLMLATLLKPDAGSIRVGGHNTATDTLAARASLGWMPDTLGAWATLSVRETVLAVCGMYGLRGAAANARTDEMLALAGLEPLAEQRSNTLSRGQKQRLSLARALVHDPKVLLLDEPASGLDPEARLTQRGMLSELAARGVAILITSHVLDELEDISTSVVFLREGRTETAANVDSALRQGTQWRVRALNEETLDAALTKHGIVAGRRASLSGNVYTVDAANNESAASLLTTLIAEGVQVVDFTPASGALEQAFVQLAHQSSKATRSGSVSSQHTEHQHTEQGSEPGSERTAVQGSGRSLETDIEQSPAQETKQGNEQNSEQSNEQNPEVTQ